MIDPPVTTEPSPPVRRRAVLVGAGALGLTGVLAACGGGDDDSGTSTQPSSDAPTSAAPTGSASTSAAAGQDLGSAADVPVKGGKVYESQKVVVTQPAAGQYKAFTAVCTHQGCLVGTVKDNVITCPCHFSKYSATDGSVRQGPARGALAEKSVEVRDGTIFLK